MLAEKPGRNKMERSFLDEIYDDLGPKHYESPVNDSEDSVDIYSGLDCSPGNKSNSDVAIHFSSVKLKDSMDLYEEIITEEQQEKEFTQNELKTKLDVAEMKLKGLEWELQKMQTQNKTLLEQNMQLKKNICALIKTAKMEILRKDEEINKMNQRSGQFRCRPPFLQSHNYFQRQSTGPDPAASGQTTESRRVCDQNNLPQLSVKDSAGFGHHPNVAVTLPLTSLPTEKVRSVCTDPKVTGSHADSIYPNNKRDCKIPNPAVKDVPPELCTKSNDRLQNRPVLKDGKLPPTERRDYQNRNEGCVSSECKAKDRDEVADHKEMARDCVKLSKDTHKHPTDLLRRSELVNIPCHQKRPSSSSIDAVHHKSGSNSKERHRDLKDVYTKSSVERRYSEGKSGTDRNAPDSRSQETKEPSSSQRSTSSRHRDDRSPLRDHRRREEKSSRRERDGRTEKCRDHGRGWRKGSDRSEKDCCKRKGEDKKERSKGQGLKHNTGTESDIVARKNQTKFSTPVSERDKLKGSRGSRLPEAALEKVSEKTSKNKKLSFMETLNLTLSPVKKPRPYSGAKEPETRPPENFVEAQEECEQFDLGADYCVIDELDSSRETLQKKCIETPVDDRESEKAEELTHECNAKNCQQQKDKLPSQVLAGDLTFESERGDENVSASRGECAGHNRELKSGSSEKVPSPEDCRLASRTDDTERDITTTFLVESQAGDYEKHNKTLEGQAKDHVHVSGSKTGDPICQTPLAAQCAIRVTQGLSSICIDVKLSPDKKTCVRKTMHNSPPPLWPESHSASTLITMEKSPGCDVHEKTCDISADTVSSTVGGLPETCKTAVTPKTTGSMDISSTECVEMSTSDHIQAKEQTMELPRASRKEVVSVEEASSSVLSPKNWPRPDSTKNGDQSPVPSSSAPLLHDEESMMLTLNSIRNIPNAISPLTSPVRPVKTQPFSSGKAPHVKSLNKEFSSVAVTLSRNGRKMDINKENQKPDSNPSQTQEMDQTSPAATSASSSGSSEDDSELEEGEIVSDSEDDSLVLASPQQNKASSVITRNNWSSPRHPKLAEKQAQKSKSPPAPQAKSGVGSKTTTGKSCDSILLAKRRFKTIVPLLPKTNPSSIPEVMDMLKLIRTLMRKKYMKLHKTFPKKSFYNIIDMAHFSFTDFVNNVTFSKLCCIEDHLKTKLNDVISMFMDKISDNGIVKRIFDQQAPNLKKKLWTFVEGQFDFLFKEIKCTLVSVCKSKEDGHSHGNEGKLEKSREIKEVPDTTTKSSGVSQHQPNGKLEMGRSSTVLGTKVDSSTMVPYRTGLGSRGKNLRLAVDDEEKVLEVPERKSQDLSLVYDSSTVGLSNSITSPEKSSARIRVFHNSSLQDKSDFEILTEQQTSSLTFNLVTDSQMGEIFKCLLQGSDLLENSVSGGEVCNWPTGTPRKDVTCGESFGVLSPNKPVTPSKLITWTDISPCKISPNSKIQMPLNPAVLDENCMLEVPSSLPFSKVAPSSTGISQRSYSILAEDLAVSLTIPSPLKSDSHLSFLHSGNGEPSSTPNCVISAHFSEDALLDGEDATEQDIHLALDSDNTSSESSGGGTWEAASEPPAFQFKPHVPMQAVVMEKSNDHFIVRIRHTSTSVESGVSHCPADQNEEQRDPTGDMVQKDTSPPLSDLTSVEESPAHKDVIDAQPCDVVTSRDADGVAIPREAATEPLDCDTEKPRGVSNETDVKTNSSGLPSSKSSGGGGRPAGKRKKHHTESRAKRRRTDVAQEAVDKPRQKKCKKVEKGRKSPKSSRSSSMSPPVSPSSLSAKNVVKRKGEVVVTWTREEDREILINLKMKGASTDTFSALSTKINKSPVQIAERFSQLMKLFKKKERMKT